LGDRCPNGTACLEDARAAIDRASLALIESCPGDILDNLVLSQPKRS
jgi:hypothetical protein